MSVTAIEPGVYRLDLRAPHQRYHNARGERVPGVTTICGELAKPALLKWAAAVERDGLTRVFSRGDEVPGKFFYETIRDAACDIGTVAHAMAEAWLRGGELDAESLDEEMVRPAGHAFGRFADWWTGAGYVLEHSELQMVSEALQVGGTADIICHDVLGRRGLVDLKTSKASPGWPYPDTFAQVAAYAALFEETHAGNIDWITIARIGKTLGDELQTYEVSDAEREAGFDRFRGALLAYNARGRLAR